MFANLRCLSLGFGQQVRCLGSRANRLKNVHTSDGGMKNGNWTCPKCLPLGFGQQVRCLGNRANRLKNAHTSDGGMKNGSWTCPKCQSINSAQHQRCMGCLEPDSISISRSPTFGFSLGADSHNTRRVGLPQSIVKFCVLRSPHIDKKSREQFEMRVKKLYMVVKTRPEDLQKKFFWLKRQRMLGAQYEIIFSYKTRLPLKPEEQKCP